MNFATTDEELRELFGEIGEVADVHIPKDRETGRPRGFAFVRFASEEQAQKAVEVFHGREVGGRALRLDIAEDRPRPPRQRRDFGGPAPSRGRKDFGGGGGGGGGGGRGGFAPEDRSQDAYTREDYARDRHDYARGDYDEGGRSGRSHDKPKRPKGSRRGLRGKKRSL